MLVDVTFFFLDLEEGRDLKSTFTVLNTVRMQNSLSEKTNSLSLPLPLPVDHYRVTIRPGRVKPQNLIGVECLTLKKFCMSWFVK